VTGFQGGGHQGERVESRTERLPVLARYCDIPRIHVLYGERAADNSGDPTHKDIHEFSPSSATGLIS